MIELCYFSLDQWEIKIHLLRGIFSIFLIGREAIRRMGDCNTLKSLGRAHHCHPHLDPTKLSDLLPVTIDGVLITWIIYPTLKSRWGKYIFKLSLVKYQFKGILGKMSTKYLDVIIWSESVWRCLGWCTRRVINYRKKWATHTLATQLGEVAGWGCELEK